MNILLFGSTGMLGYEINHLFHSDIKVFEYRRDYFEIFNTKNEINRDNLYRYIKKCVLNYHITHIINCIASTNTRLINTQKEFEIESFTINSLFPKVLAEICNEFNLKLIHFSTDYVFSEHSPVSVPFPTTTYGYHKLIGEQFIQNMISNNNYLILRVGWLYGTNKEKSFIHKFIVNCCNTLKNNNTTVKVVSNQSSTPTSCQFVAEELFNLLQTSINGIVSIAPSGDTNRFVFATKILEVFSKYGHWFDNIKIEPYICADIAPQDTTLRKFDVKHYISDDGLTWQEDLNTYIEINKQHFIDYIEDLI